ncbi:MAG: hypothetical protein ABNH26_11700 [Celeribacter sp.]|jgi:hypothetical protein
MGRRSFLGLLLAGMLSVGTASPALAEFTMTDRSGAWFFYTQRGLGQGFAACQVVSCLRGVCSSSAASRTQFSLYDARDGRGAMPEFISPQRARPGQNALLDISGARFELSNLYKSPQYYMMSRTPAQAQEIIARLRGLEEADSNAKFHVTDPQGRRHEFTVRGVSVSLDRMQSRCTSLTAE